MGGAGGSWSWPDRGPEVAGFLERNLRAWLGFFGEKSERESFKRESNRGDKRYKIRKYIYLNILH